MLVIVIVDLCLNELCYVFFFNIMKVKKKLIDEKIFEEYGVDFVLCLLVFKVSELFECEGGVKVEFVVELVEKFCNEVGVI